MKNLQIQLDLTDSEADLLISAITQFRVSNFGGEPYEKVCALQAKIAAAHYVSRHRRIDEIVDEQNS